MKFSKRITSLSLSAALLLNTTAITVAASADNTTSKVYAYDGYTVEYFVRAEWQGNQNIEVKITNTGTEPISYWAVGYEAGGEISGLWNAQVLGQQDTEYILCGAGYNNEISPSASINFGYTLSGESFKIPQKIVNCAKRVDITDGYNVYYNIIGDYGATYQAEMIVENLSDEDISAWSLSFDGNASIDNLWNGKLFENADFHFSVRGENNTTIFANNSVTFNFTGTKSEDWSTDEDNIYEITFENYHLSGISVPLEFGFEEEIDPELDTDGDGLPDYIEKEIGSDRYKSDTDDDGLPDGYEFYRVGTDPTKADTDDNGISDADEDADDDGLTNIEEYTLGTNPAYFDTDYDGLSDYDELYKYTTNPLVFDTDGDKVSDGDEVTLGLDPNNPATFGYPDNEYTTQQTVNEDDPALQAINSIEDNPFTISVDITAAGVAENCLSASESGYSYPILQNDAVLGVVPELSYSDGLSVTDVVIKFNIDDEAVSDRLGLYSDDPLFDGINRFVIFKYFEEDNILLPIETTYDGATNSVSTHVDEVGTYCLIDMEKWVNNIANMEPGNYYLEEDTNDPANIVFCIDTRDIIDSDSFDSIKSGIKEVVDDAFERYTDIKVYIYYQKFGSNFRVTNNLLKDNKGNNYFTEYESAVKALDKLEKYFIKSSFWAYDYVEATQFMLDTCAENATESINDDKETKTIIYHIVSDKRVMGSSIKAKRLLTTLENDDNIYVSTLCPFSDMTIDEFSYASAFAKTSHGMVLTASDYIGYYGGDDESSIENDKSIVKLAKTSVELISSSNTSLKTDDIADEKKQSDYKEIKNQIIEILGDGQDGTKYWVITPIGHKPIKLDAPLNKSNRADSDGDGLPDWDEVNFEKIEKYYRINNPNEDFNYGYCRTVKNSDLPTLIQCQNDIYNYKGYRKDLKDYFIAANTYSRDLRILPIISNPIDPDSDNDGVIDKYDGDKLNPEVKKLTKDKDGNSGCLTVFSSLPIPFGKQAATIKNDITALAYPTQKQATGKQYSKDEKVYAYAVVYCDGEFWIKIKSETLYSKFEYIHYSDIANKIKLAEDLIEAKDKLDKEIDTYYSDEEPVRIMKSVDSKKYIEGQGFSDITSAEYVFNHNGWTFYQCAAFAGQIYCAIWDKYLRTRYVNNKDINNIPRPKLAFPIENSDDDDSDINSVDKFIALIRGLRPGTYMRISTNKVRFVENDQYNLHSIIISEIKDDTFTVFDANNDHLNGVRCKKYTCAEFIQSYKSTDFNTLYIYQCFDPYYMLTD